MTQTMEENKELNSEAPPSTSAAAKPSSEEEEEEVTNNSSKSREEGELSSSDDDGLPSGSASEFSRDIAALAESTQDPPANENIQSVKAAYCTGKSTTSTETPASFGGIPSRASVSNPVKNFEKNRGPFVPFVISFSDNDSGSESEEHKEGKSSETRSNERGGDQDRGPPASSLHKSHMSQRDKRNETKVMPRKLPLTRTFVSPVTNTDGPTSKKSGPLLLGQRFGVRSSTTAYNSFYGKRNADNQNVHVNTSKLQDLRQQIAIRENELKLKSAQQSKERAPSSSNIMNLNNDVASRCRRSSTDFMLSESKEREKKRLKVSEAHPSKLIFDCQQEMPPVQSMLASEKTIQGHCVQWTGNDHTCQDKDIQLCKTRVGIGHWQKQHDNQDPMSLVNLPSRVKNGNTNSLQSASNNPADPSILTEQIKRGAYRNIKDIHNKPNTEECKHPRKSSSLSAPSSLIKKGTSGHNLIRCEDNQDFRSGHRALKSMSRDMDQGCSLQASLNNGTIWNCLRTENSNMDIESLLDIEELHDKELEEAQDHRRKCEIEETNALKAYRKAQRALIEANARCSYLYRKRELYSAQFRSVMTEDSSLFWSSRLPSHRGAGLNYSNNVSDVNLHLAPASSSPLRNEFDVFNPPGYLSNIQSVADDALQSGSDNHLNPQNLASDPCSEHDASTSEPQRDKGLKNGVCSPGDLDTSGDEAGETFPSDNRSVQSDPDSQGVEISHEKGEKEINNDAKRKIPVIGSEDSLLLEASLRSQLVARLGTKALSRKRAGPCDVVESKNVRGTEDDDGVEKTDLSTENILLSAEEKGVDSDLGVIKRAESISEPPLQINNSSHVEKSFSQLVSAANPLHSCSVEGCRSRNSITFLSPVLRSAFRHAKAADPIKVTGLQAGEQDFEDDIYSKKSVTVLSDESQPSMLTLKPMEETFVDICGGEVGSYTCNHAIDPVWPLCMFELRGKCNNDECCWQHVRDHSCRVMNSDGSDAPDSRVVLPSHRGNNGATNHSKCVNYLVPAPPTYLVTLDILKADSHYKSLPAQSINRCWRKCFSSFLVLTGLIPTHLPSDEPFLHGTEARIEVHGSWNKQSLYFHSKNGKMSQLDQCKVDSNQSMEMALLNLSQEANKQRGRLESLKVLARALEADPTSVLLWTVYLHIYYSIESNGKDDMFRCAIEHNEGSYELWLMYINSRIQLSDRLVAYDNALATLCRVAASSDRDPVHDSACILDIFLQMMNCFCISGNSGKAIERTNGLLPITKNSDKSHPPLLSDIIPCLNISDKCIFWICCVYLVIYRKLPDAVAHQLECPKELSAIEWHSAHLKVAEKQHAVLLMELAVDSLAIYIDSESLESENTLKATHMFALNHIRCVEVLEGTECSKTLLDKYTKLYPSCLELILMSARAQIRDCGDLNFLGFEDALSQWPEEVPGVHCIWNQYIECAFQSGRFEVVQKLMDQWFNSVCNASASTLELDAWIANSNQIDVLFGLLNFSLSKLLQNNLIEGRLAIDKALKVATPEYYSHCVREHAMFLLRYGGLSKETASISGILDILKGYLINAWSFPTSEPLSRSFIQSIKKPRLRQLVSNIWSPVSSNSFLVNLVLEVWHGPSLLPHRFSKLQDVVDFVEAVLDIAPGNYQLAISVCKLLISGSENAEMSSPSVSFWASSLLVNSLFQAVPVAPEYVWVEAVGILLELTNFRTISESFHKRAVSVYPFSIKLWESYLKLSRVMENADAVIESAKERGINLQ